MFSNPVGTFAASVLVAGALGAAAVGLAGSEILANTDLSRRQAAVFVVAAVENYCAEHTNLFE